MPLLVLFVGLTLAVARVASAQEPGALTGPAPGVHADYPAAQSRTDFTTGSLASEFPGSSQPESLRRLFRALAADFQHLPARENLWVVSFGGSLAAMARPTDHLMSSALTAPGVEEALDPGRVIGGGTFQIGGATLTYVAGRILRKPTVAAVGSELVRAQLVAQAMTQGLKHSVRRLRPDGTNFSFPSGHVSGSFASATVLLRRFGWKAGGPAYAAAAYVAASRMADRKHFLSDVLFGAAVGIVAGRTVEIGIPRAPFSLVPTPMAGGVGFALVKK